MTTKITLKRFAVLTPDGRAGLVLQSSPQAKIVPVEITFTA